MVATIAAGTSARYYLQQTEYYLGSQEPEGRWLITGPGLSITAGQPVERAAFERLHAARDEQGRSLLGKDHGRAERTGGYDVTFSAPKSVSLLAALGDPSLRRAVEAAQEQAVTAALGFLDRNGAFCRRGKGGATREPVRLTVALFQHGEARPAKHEDGAYFSDPALHHHAVCINLSMRGDGSFGALDGRYIYHLKMSMGAIYHLELSSRLQSLGFAINNTGSNGLFEVAGIDPDLCRYFSARRHEIEDELAAAGVARSADAPALAAAKARTTRGAKRKSGPGVEPENRHAVWRKQTTARGFDPEQVVEAALLAGREPTRSLSPEQTEALIRARVDAVPRSLTETQSVFEHRNLVAGVAAALVGTGADAGRAEFELQRLVTEGAVVTLDRDGRWPHPVYSTPEVIAIERELQAMAEDLAACQVAVALDPIHGDGRSRTVGLNLEQAAAVRQATGPAVIGIVEGAPGSGKTTLLRPVVEHWTETGWCVIGAATAWKVAHALRDDLGIEARAIDGWLAGAEHGRPFLTDKTLLVIDEAGLLSSRQLHRILSEIQRARTAGHEVALRLVGDRKQLQAIGGPGLRIVADVVGTARVDTIVRQREAWAREVVTHLGQGRAAEALALLDAHGAIEECANPKATAVVMVAAWNAARAAQPDAPAPLLIARTNAQVLALNAGVRAALRRDGNLAPEDAATLTAVTASGHVHRLGLAPGDRVRFLTRLDALGVVNGTEATLTRIETLDPTAPGASSRLTARIGAREVSFTPKDLADVRGRVRLSHAYASTIYGCQGMTTETALVWADTGLDRHNAFVALSRARGDTRVFVDRASLVTQLRQDRPLDDRSRESNLAERRAVLGRGMSRSSEKASTLDLTSALVPPLEPRRLPPLPASRGVGTPKPAAAVIAPPGTRRARSRRRGREAGREG
ncbi:MobF family relaxase [Methylobacterium aquaticum]|uniref:MobF family relaxase n=1 Tax=Methylobacterium aquaticum TaxID=270351 RepID=UPI001934379A|nr:MobF family relaxase [Methylobacterium aquaticum]